VPNLREWWAGRDPIAVPVVAQVVALFQRPQKPRLTFTLRGVERPYPYPWTDGRVPFVGRPDWDQVGKAGVDVLVQAGILLDDPLVVDATTPRWYTAVGESPCVEVRLWTA
jgi:Holliday junction resolvase RusA-like endonuclease